MQPFRDLAIVLRSVRFEDRHRIVTALSESHGKITVMARNSIQSRRFGGTLELFTAAEWTLVHKPGAEMGRLDEAVVRRDFPGLRADFDKLAVGSLFSELMLRLAPAHDPCPELFKLHSNALAVLEEAPAGTVYGPIINAFLAKLLQWAGTQPLIHACLKCSTPLGTLKDLDSDPGVACLVSDAGWICGDCRATSTHHVQKSDTIGIGANLMEVPVSALLDLYTSLHVPIRKVSESTHAGTQAHAALTGFLTGLMAYHVPGFDRSELKSLRFLPGSTGSLPANPLR